MQRGPLPMIGAAVAVLLLSGGCASDDDELTNAPATIQSSAEAAVVEVTVSMTDGAVSFAPHRVRVAQGSTVRLQVTSDVDEESELQLLQLEVR